MKKYLGIGLLALGLTIGGGLSWSAPVWAGDAGTACKVCVKASKQPSMEHSSPCCLSVGQTVDLAVSSIRKKTDFVPQVGIVLGSGFGPLADDIKDAVEIPYRDIDCFPVCSAEGHDGKLVFGYLEGVPVVVMRGRVHLYEGYTPEQVVLPVRVMKALGAENLIVTNASGGVNPDLKVGDVVLMKDHLNMMGANPCAGVNDPKIGPRFFSMSRVYPASLRRLAKKAAAEMNFELVEGVYAGMLGPSYETPTENRMLQILGVDAVGMSTVPEVIAAAHCGMPVLGLSCVTDVLDDGSVENPHELNHENVLRAVEEAYPKMFGVIKGVLRSLKR